jgi:hypothetical protein
MSIKNNKKPKETSCNILNLSGTGPVIRTVPVVHLDRNSESESESSVDFGTDSAPEAGTSLGTNSGPRLGSEIGPDPCPTPDSDSGPESISVSAPAETAAPTPVSGAPGKRKRKTRKGHTDFAQHLPHFGEATVVALDRARNDLLADIEKVIRVQGAFVKKLNLCASKSARVKHIITAVEEVPFHCRRQIQIVEDSVKEILEINDKRAKRRRDDAQAGRDELKRQHYATCAAFGINVKY